MNVLRLGYRLRTSGRGALLAGVLFLGFFIIALVGSLGTYTGAQEREFARSPEESVSASQAHKMRLEWVPSWGEYGATHGYFFDMHGAVSSSASTGTGGNSLGSGGDSSEKNAHGAVASQAGVSSACVKRFLPPGLDRSLKPGEAVVSPVLAHTYPVGSDSPLGKIVGTIPVEALSNPQESFFYSAPKGPLPAQWGVNIAGFPGGTFPVNGDQLDASPYPYVVLFFLFFTAVPGLVLLVAGLFHSEQVRYASMRLGELGASCRQRFVFGVASMLKPLVVGVVLIAGVGHVFSRVYVSLPLVSVTVVPSDFRRCTGLFFACLGVMVVVLVVLAGLNGLVPVKKSQETVAIQEKNDVQNCRTKPFSRRKMVSSLKRLSEVSVICSVVFLWIFVTQPELRGLPLQIVFFGAVISLGCAIPVVSLWCSEAIVTIFSRFSTKGVAILAHRKMASFSSNLKKSMLGISCSLVALGACQLYSLQFSEPMAEAMRLDKVLNGRVVDMNVGELQHSEIESLRKKMNVFGGTILRSEPQGEKGISYIQIDEQAIKILGLHKNEAPDSFPSNENRHHATVSTDMMPEPARTLMSSMGDEFVITPDIPSDIPLTRMSIVSDTSLPLSDVISAGATYGLTASNPGHMWIGAAKVLTDKLSWFILLGIPAGLALVFTALYVNYKQLLERLGAKELQNVLSLSGKDSLTFVGFTAFLPLVLCSVFVFFGYTALVAGFAGHSGGFVAQSSAFRYMLGAIGITGALFLSAFVLRSMKN